MTKEKESALPVLHNETQKVRDHFEGLAKDYDAWKDKNSYYYGILRSFVKRYVRPGGKVLEVGCATGEMLAASRPAVGVGVDISPAMVKIAEKKYPQYRFVNAAIENFHFDEKFDYVLLVDVVHHLYDVMEVFEKIKKFCHPTTKVIMTWVNPWWEPTLRVAEKLKLKMPEVPLNYLERRNIREILAQVDFTVNQMGSQLLLPKKIPVLSAVANTIGVRLPILNKLAFVQYLVAQPLSQKENDLGLGCSVIIPCYNEEGNICEAIKRIPQMGKGTEIIVVNDGSKDQTAAHVRAMQKECPNLKLVDYSPNHGKGYAVLKGFEAASQEVLMILDADMTVVPEELPRFFAPLNKGQCQFVNGTRLVYPMENRSMRFLNHLGNKIFSLIMSFILNQTITDTLCGTKAFYKDDLKFISFGYDKWGDFDLLFGAAKLGNRILEVPVHYKERKAGVSKMKAFQHGIHLLKACWWGFRDVVFMPDKKSHSSTETK